MRDRIDLDGTPRAHPQGDPTPTVIDLDRVLLALAAVTAWTRTIQAATPRLQGLSPAAIPDEQSRVLPDGRLQIFVTLPKNRGEVTLDMPPGQWSWRFGRA